ncbi:putative receptor-like protein kinase At4g00960 isoform X2 [Carica papaya]|uniref:putative receptor-like protein kinase At4g00960 isoform X2 n=1 Tax=Carica papaya TaxID=3649 RepID=UPI000B8CD1D6|nr:putative receptor-like protein kinase At4g00960 isoform X2 [Carica papaya]
MEFLSSLLTCFCKQLNSHADDEWKLSFDPRTLQIATNFFSDLNLVGKHGFCPVYRGLMPNGQEVAVKKLPKASRESSREFRMEIDILVEIQHKNLVTFLGYCEEGPEMMLVYEYLPNNSLEFFLFDKDRSWWLDWKRRFQIIKGVADGLLYLHEEAFIRIVHRNIGACNVLLDEQFNPKISALGQAKLFPGNVIHIICRVSGIIFGILVLEIVSGISSRNLRQSGDMSDLLSYTWRLYEEDEALELVDSSLASYNRNQAELCIKLGLLCCQESVDARPDMKSINLILSADLPILRKPIKPRFEFRNFNS